MEQLIASVLEKSLVGGAFIYLLHSFVTKFNVGLESVANTLVQVSNTLTSVLNTLNSMDSRMGKLEDRVNELEEKQ